MKKFIYTALSFSPIMALAQTAPGNIDATAKGLANTFKNVVNILIPAMFGLAIIYFFYGVAKYILNAGEQDKAKEGKSIMIYGVIAIAVMATLYGLVAFLAGAVGITPSSSVTLPTVQ